MKDIEKRMETMAKTNDTKNQNQQGWQLNRRINLSILIQLVFLASLIVGSWLNLQRQLDLLQHDVTILLQSQKNFEQKLESLQIKNISYEYRLRTIEKHIPTTNIVE
jgi:Tfp pilus assembly protein PilO